MGNKITAEISLYPLSVDYEEPILEFIRILKSNPDLVIRTTAMSTLVKGELTTVMNAIRDALVASQGSINTASLVIKIINRDLPIEEGYLEL